MTEHPQRCETCSHKTTNHNCTVKRDAGYRIWMGEEEKELIELVGCASHSSASETAAGILFTVNGKWATAHDAAIAKEAREQVLDELQTFIEGCDLGTISVAKLVCWMSARGYDCD